MNIARTFSKYCDSITLKSTETFDTSIASITKKLNQHYYESDSDSEHQYIVGSIGRETAVEDVSDVDIIFDLSRSVYNRFDAHEGNGQSHLLQEVKEVLLERYPRTKLKGDGQIVSIQFTDYTIELVPGFKRDDDNFDYADSNNGGSWRITKPFPEQRACKNEDFRTAGTYGNLCRILRCWKNNIGITFGGLLIDTLVDDFCNKEKIGYIPYEEYITLLKSLFSYLKKLNPDQQYWYAIGSGQQVNNTGNGIFVKKSDEAYKQLDNAVDGEEMEQVLIDLLGRDFENCIIDGAVENKLAMWQRQYAYIPNEEFIRSKFPVDIQNFVAIECTVEQNGFRPYSLKSWLQRHRWLAINKSLEFSITSTDVIPPYDVYWKVKNCGEEAYKKRMVRGSIFSGKDTLREKTNFNGEHYVECYLVKDGICVARNKLLVPINTAVSDEEYRRTY